MVPVGAALPPAAPERAVTRLLTANGAFLVAAGGIQLVQEVCGHAGVGPYRTMFHESAYTIGFVEAHGLALLVGGSLLAERRRPYRRANHALALATHVLLGTANIAFRKSFREFGIVAPGVVATVAHAVFAAANARVLMRSRGR